MVVRISGGGAITGISQIDVAGAINNTTIVSILASSILDLGGTNSNSVVVTGTAVIVGLGVASPGLRRTTRFIGTPTLVHNATSMILLGGSNIVLVSGDTADWMSLGSGNWCMLDYSKTTPTADSTPVPNTGILSGTTGQDYQVSSAEPTTRSVSASSSPLISGDLWFDTVTKKIRIYDSALADWTNASADAAVADLSINDFNYFLGQI